MNSSIIQIHEFSTGIQAEKTPDGGWVSRGFTGEYINKTIDPIPMVVQNAIRNRDFAVAEGASSDDPAIIGREVQSGGVVWSVVAVVTRGRDDKGRSASMYRYFLCEGGGNLGKILAWLDTQKAVRAGRIPIFDPFEAKFMGQPTVYQPTNLRQIDLQQLPLLYSLLAGDAPVLVPVTQRCDTSIVNHMATEKARQTGRPIAWAYKVEALEQPRGFVVIQPASEKAEQLLQRSIASTPQYTAPISGEYDIKSAIKGLISRDTVKAEQVQAIETALAQRVQDNDWEVIFNGQGANQARAQGIYSPQMVRLMTLRAMVIPETVSEFLVWMRKRGKQEDHYQVSQAFQFEIIKSIPDVAGNGPNLAHKVNEGVRLIIPRLLEQPELLTGVTWLLGSSEGLWQQIYFLQVAAEINEDFNLMEAKVRRQSANLKFHVISHPEWKGLITQLEPYWKVRTYRDQEDFLPLAELFSQLESANLESPKLAAVFYHASTGKVPKEIFQQLPNKKGIHSTIYGLAVERKVDFSEWLWVELIEWGDEDMKLKFVVPITLVGMFVSFLGGRYLFPELPEIQPVQNSQQEQTNNNQGNNNQGNTSQNPSLFPTNKEGNQQVNPTPPQTSDSSRVIIPMPPGRSLNNAHANFLITMTNIEFEVVQSLFNELSLEDPSIDKITVINQLKLILRVPDITTYNDSIANRVLDKVQQKEWIDAIYTYQTNNTIGADGVVDKTGKTVTNLKNAIKKNLASATQTNPSPQPNSFNSPSLKGP